jgi:predicted nucleotidyltransferase
MTDGGVRDGAELAGAELGSGAHGELIARVAAHYRDDDRVLAVAVFGSVSAGTWHELSDVDFDIVLADQAAAEPDAEVAALFGSTAVIVLTKADCADVVLDSGQEASFRWHPLPATSPNITGTVRVVAGQLTAADIAAAGEANRAAPDTRRLLDAAARDAIGARKALARERAWEAAAAVERVRASLTALRGGRDGLRLDLADPAGALRAVLAVLEDGYDLGPRRRALLARFGAGPDALPPMARHLAGRAPGPLAQNRGPAAEAVGSSGPCAWPDAGRPAPTGYPAARACRITARSAERPRARRAA